MRKKLITIQQNTPTLDAARSPKDSWADVATAWASFEEMTGREFFGSAQFATAQMWNVTIRPYRPDVALAPKMRLLLGTRAFNILSVANSGERNREWHLRCEETSTIT